MIAKQPLPPTEYLDDIYKADKKLVLLCLFLFKKNFLKAWFRAFILVFFLFIYGFVAALGLSPVAESGGYSLLWCAGSRHAGFSSCGPRAQ